MLLVTNGMVLCNPGRRRFLKSTAAASLIGIAGCTGGGGGDEETTTEEEQLQLRIGTSTGGTRDVGLAVERAVSQKSDKLEYSTIESPGYIGTIYRLDQEQFDGGLTDNNSLNKARTDQGKFAEKPVDLIPWQGFYAFPYSIYFVARDGSGIETFDDLAEANVYPAEPGFSTRATTLDVFSQPQVKDVYDQMNIMNMDVGDSPGALEEGRIDAIIAYGAPGVRYTGFVQEYSARVDVHYVEPTDALIEAAESFPGAGTSRTPYDEWSIGQDIGTDEVFTWDLQIQYVFGPWANEDAVYELCRVVYEHNDVVNNGEEQFNDFETVEDMLGAAMPKIPFHPGAAQFYKDRDAWDDSLKVGSQ